MLVDKSHSKKDIVYLFKKHGVIIDDKLSKGNIVKNIDRYIKDFKFSGDDRVFTAVDPEEFTVYAFKYRDERDPKFPYKDEEPFLSDEGYEPQIIKVDGKKVAVTVGNI